jgi:hypothetical protein
MYPNDLMAAPESGMSSNKYGGNYVVFYINVHEDSYLVPRDEKGNISSTAPIVYGVPPREAGNIAGAKYSTATFTAGATVATTAAAAAGDAAGKIINGYNAVTGDSVKASPVASGIINGAVGVAVAGAVVTAIGGANKEYKRLNTAIALNVPTDLQIRYSASWEPDNLAGSMALLEGLSSNIVSPGKTIQAAGGYLAGAALKTSGIGSALSKSSGVAGNPKKEQIFREVDFRTFTFSYQFFPRSKNEADNVRNIIKEFKLHMHPELKKDRANFLYIYPSEFDIYYYQNGAENLNIHRHTSCVLTDMNVLYTPQGVFTAFDGGMPSQINVTLTFKELAILTKENIKDGF